jgi:hypothetical protein
VSAILIISVFLIVAASIAILRTKRPPSNNDVRYFPPGFQPPRLFDEGNAPDEESETKASEEFEKSLLSRASCGDLEVLKEARASGIADLYQRILDKLVERCVGNADELRSLADFITRNEELRANAALAVALLEDWERSPSRAFVPQLLRVAALSDDAATFERAMSSVLRARGDGRLKDMSVDEMRSLFEGEYWLLSSESKRSGAGFLLKQRLAYVRRELSAETRRDNSPTAGDTDIEVSAQKERQ